MKTGTAKNRPSSIVNRQSSGFTLVEMLVTLTVVLILISATARLGQYIRTRASIQLAQSALAVIETALQQYYDDFGKFPFSTNVVDTNANGFLDEYVGSYAVVDGAVPDNDRYFDSSAALFYFLDCAPSSRSVVSALVGSLITNKDAAGTALVIQIPAGGSNRDLVRFIDPWGTSLWYLYDPVADSFPQVISAGPDKKFETTADNIENN